MVKTPSKIRVYWNLHKKCWSVQDCKTNKVVRHTSDITLTNATFIVRPSGQKRVQLENKKNVHAFAVGYEYIVPKEQSVNRIGVMYNPYLGGNFRYIDTKQEIPKEWTGNLHLYRLTYKNKPRVEILTNVS